ncbi:MAG TPA: hypothetical protein VFM70_04985 [Salinimicrobium sp.]|nr:hypothetical protein [Salinimicrobium sp.]
MEHTTQDMVIKEVKDLISYSIQSEGGNSKYQKMHCDILEKYFEAKNIKINYSEKTVDLQLPITGNQYTNITFECLDLDGFLQSCLKKDQKSLYYYQNLLSQFNTVNAA